MRQLASLHAWVSAAAAGLLISLGIVGEVAGADIYSVKTAPGEDQFSYVYILGPIERGDDEKFRLVMLDLIRTDFPPYETNIFSNGGAVAPAMSIGRQIKLLMLPVSAPFRPVNKAGEQTCMIDERTSDGMFGNRVEWTYNYKTGRGDRRCRCDSACFLIWAGGGKRWGEGVYIHRPYFDAQEFSKLAFHDARDSYQRMQTEVTTYLRELEVPESVITRMFTVDSKDISNLTEQEYRQLQARPYADELLIARCGASVVKTREEFRWAFTNEGRNKEAARIMENVRKRNSCEHKFWRELFNEQKRHYLSQYDR